MICAAERGEKKFYPGMYSSPSIHLFIGPEGGWSSAELALFVARGIECVTFGERILKSETAGIVIPALLLQ
jgi:RsmE family RNA methyltransferase